VRHSIAIFKNQNRTGSLRSMREVRFPISQSGLESIKRRWGKRLMAVSTAIDASVRASNAPTQKWAP
jgi:hypothetical protein